MFVYVRFYFNQMLPSGIKSERSTFNLPFEKKKLKYSGQNKAGDLSKMATVALARHTRTDVTSIRHDVCDSPVVVWSCGESLGRSGTFVAHELINLRYVHIYSSGFEHLVTFTSTKYCKILSRVSLSQLLAYQTKNAVNTAFFSNFCVFSTFCTTFVQQC